MTFGAIRGRASPGRGDYLLASAITGLGLPALAWLFIQVFPKGCDLRGDPEVFRWTCLLPGLLFMVPMIVAVVLPLAMLLNRKLARRLPDGWLPAGIATGIATHLVLILGYAFALDPAYRGAFLSDSLLIPQPFVAGALAGTLYSLSLHLRGRSPSS